MQSQQSWRELPQAPPVARPQMSPSGSQPFGFEQVPTGGLVPATRLQWVLPAPGSMLPGAPQQSLSRWHRSPMTWQPLAGWQMLTPEGA